MSDDLVFVLNQIHLSCRDGLESLAALVSKHEDNSRSIVDCGHSIRDGLEAVAKSIDRLVDAIKEPENGIHS